MSDLSAARNRLAQARLEVAEALDAARTACLDAIADGVPEAAIARALGVDRMTVRKWAGKR